MNQQCKVCGEPAAGFHFGAFTCEGCKSFFGRSYNNLNSIADCKNNGQCVINKKNRTACKACRLRKCLLVGMSKSGSRYGRRSNWFKIHCLLQEQQQQQQQMQNQQSSGGAPHSVRPPQRTPPPHHHQLGLSMLGQQFPPHLMHLHKSKEELMLMGLDEYKHAASPSVSSPESHNSDSSIEISEASMRMPPLFPSLMLHHPTMLFPPGYPVFTGGLLQPANNNNRLLRNFNTEMEALNKRVYLETVLKSQRPPTPSVPAAPAELPVHPKVDDEEEEEEEEQQPHDVPIDLSMKTLSERGSSPAQSDRTGTDATEQGSEADEESECDSVKDVKRVKIFRPLDLTTKV